jgi:hypothetical protein
VWAAAGAGCGSSVDYSQETPEDLVRSAITMIRRGEASRLDDLIYAEDERMRAALVRLGDLLGRMQQLGSAVQKRFPEEVAALRTRAEEAVKDGRAGQLVLSLGGRPSRENEQQMQSMATAILADPYGWMDRNADRLGAMLLSEDLAVLTIDGQPALQPIGVPLRRDGGKWYFALPMNVPGVSRAMPRTDAEWAIIGYAMRTLDRAVGELTEDVRSGRIGSIKALQDELGDKLMGPGLMVFIAYNRELDVRRRRERLERQFDKREREWIKSREEAGQPPLPAVREAIAKVAPDRLDRLARQDKRPNIEAMPPAEFVAFVETMLADAGLEITLAETDEQRVRDTLARWEAAQAAAKKRKMTKQGR